jgi:hypothetical protein
MDTKLMAYRQLIKGILTKYAALFNRKPVPGAEDEVVFTEFAVS